MPAQHEAIHPFISIDNELILLDKDSFECEFDETTL